MGNYADGENEVVLSGGEFPEDTTVKIFVWEMGTLRPSLYNATYTLSDILLQ